MVIQASETIKIELAKIAPVWLQKEKTIEKVVSYIHDVARNNCDIIIFGEAFTPSCPFWIELTDSAGFLPLQGKNESLFFSEINYQRVREERQNFDPSGHYSRPDVVQLQVNRQRQSVIKINDE